VIYLDNAATTMRKPPQVAEAVMRAMNTMGNASRGAHREALTASRIVYDTRVKLAGLFHCSRADHVAFTCNSTEALNIAIHGVLEPGDHVVTTVLEHNSVLRPLYRHESARGGSLSFVRSDALGRPIYEDFEALITPKTRAIVCTHASNLTGNVVDLMRVGKIAAEHGLLLIADASQTAGVIPIDMEAMHIDILCFTGHKGLMGPQGTGGLCIREGVEVRPWKVGGSGVQSYNRTQPNEYPTRLEAGTLNSHGIAGLSSALDFILDVGIETIARHEEALMRRFYEGVRSIPGVRVYGDFSGAEKSAIVALNIGDWDSASVADELSVGYDIAVRPGAHCAPLMHRALGTEEQGAVRFSFSWYNTEEEIDTAIRAIRELAEE
jgi:cysteine desulfurase family protein